MAKGDTASSVGGSIGGSMPNAVSGVGFQPPSGGSSGSIGPSQGTIGSMYSSMFPGFGAAMGNLQNRPMPNTGPSMFNNPMLSVGGSQQPGGGGFNERYPGAVGSPIVGSSENVPPGSFGSQAFGNAVTQAGQNPNVGWMNAMMPNFARLLQAYMGRPQMPNAGMNTVANTQNPPMARFGRFSGARNEVTGT